MKGTPVIIAAALIIMVSAASLRAGLLSVAHRGDSLFAPENTVSAFSSAIGKADLVEFDVHMSADGHFVVIHDSTVDRTTDGSGSVSGLTLAQLKALDAGSWFSPTFMGEQIPTLSEATTAILASGRTPLIEHKAGTAADYVGELDMLGVAHDVVVQSFNWDFLSEVNTLDPDIVLAALGSGRLSKDTLNTIQAKGADIVAWSHASVTATEVALVHDRGMQLYVWTVNNETRIQSLFDLGVDGIITDNPGLVTQLVPEPPWTTVREPVPIYSVTDNDSDLVLDDLGDIASDRSSATLAGVGESDTEDSDSITRLLVKFELPDVLKTVGELKSATLRFFLADILGTPAGPVSVFHSVVDNDLLMEPSDYEADSYTDTLVDLVPPTALGQAYYEADVTHQVLADYAADGFAPRTAFRLQINDLVFVDDEQGGRYRFTMPGAEADHPELVLTFVPEPCTFSLAALGFLGLLARTRLGSSFGVRGVPPPCRSYRWSR